MMKHGGKCAVALIAVFMIVISMSLSCCGNTQGSDAKDQGAGNSSTAVTSGDKTTDDVSIQELSKKMDTAIKMLTVVKQELDASSVAEREKAASGAESSVTLADTVKEKAAQGVRVIEKLKEASSDGTAKDDAKPGDIGTKEWAESVEKNVDTLTRVGQKVGNVIAAYSTASGEYTTDANASLSDSLQTKIDKTIHVLNAVKKELNDKKDEQSGGGSR
ncbi:MAG TPA: hypothetical protein PKY78_03955 [Candidatus Omnitrophota bacterium]|nr:hypothetical protein [Candidatus Omnitrophota bacterium]